MRQLETLMRYDGPETRDFENVRALNVAFLDLLARQPPSGGLLDALQPVHRDALRRLSVGGRERLAGAPFLLYRFSDALAVQAPAAASADAARDLFAETGVGDPDTVRFIASALGFAWQLALRNPYALRLISGADLAWCETLRARPLVELVSVACADPTALAVRGAATPALWDKLLHEGLDDEAPLRRAARTSGWQMLLTRSRAPQQGYRNAARQATVPALRRRSTR